MSLSPPVLSFSSFVFICLEIINIYPKNEYLFSQVLLAVNVIEKFVFFSKYLIAYMCYDNLWCIGCF